MSAAPSSGLRLASGYFLLTGGLGVIGTAVALLSLASRPEEVPLAALAVGVGINLAFCVAHLWTGRQLAERSRRGGRVAIALLALPLLNLLLGSVPSVLSLVMAVVGITIVVSVWSELA